MVANQSYPFISPDEYLEKEATSLVKHEYFDGDVYAMAGASDAHVTISLNCASLLRTHVRGSGCRVFMADMKARLNRSNRFLYPDVMVTCDDRDRSMTLFKCYPCLIIEVLSDSTEAFDRGDKFADYQEMETLIEYVLISQTRQRLDCFRRNDEGFWVLQSYKLGDKVHLKSVDFYTTIEEIYEDVVIGEAIANIE
ncbi:MAG: Uma2 family endonuclease [Timaviella obliquedivisa GSE-PSE-MK23-08B]|jgi:Uma2 family endonuclease|nr:Uma2 family endonuclease [Timaviella obliquedivisa GSE-PSE-MK23-08B]